VGVALAFYVFTTIQHDFSYSGVSQLGIGIESPPR